MNTTTPRSICIVDDDPFLLDMYNIKFRQAGHHVECFTESEKALTYLRTRPVIDALLLDIVMPKMNGYELLRFVREENLCGSTTSIVILSNQGQDTDIAQAEVFGIDAYLVKANTLPSEVLSQAEAVIAKKQSPEKS